MIGSLTKCIAEFLRNTEVVKENNIPVYTANTVEGRFTVNTSLPAILVTVAPSENPTVFISGNILDSIIIHIRYMDDLLNYTMSEDDGIYEERRNWAYLLRDELWNGKQSSYFKQFMNVNGLNIMYKGMSTYTQVGVLENLSKDIDVFSFIFSCNLFSDQLSNFPTVPLEEFFITLEGAHGETPEPTFQTVRASGEKFVIWNSVRASDKVKNLSIYGRSYQGGTPTPIAPLEIQSVGDNSLLLQIGNSKESVNRTIDIKKAIQDAGYDGVLRSIGVLRDDVNYNNETNECILNKRLGISRGFIVNSFTNQESNGNLRFVRINGSVRQGSVSASIQNFYSNKFYYTGDSTSNKWNNVYGVYTNSLRYGFYLVYHVNDYPTEDDLKKMIEDEDTVYIYALQDEIEANIALKNIPTYSNETWISTKKENVNPRIVMDCEVSEILDYIRDGLIGYYTGRGRSNTDENKNILPDLSGNGNDLENKNFAYTPESGYGDGYIQYDGVDDYSILPLEKVLEKGVKTQMFVLSATQSTTETDNKWNGGIVTEGYYFAIKQNTVLPNSDYEQVYLNGKDVKSIGFNINGSTDVNNIVISSSINTEYYNRNFNISTILNAVVYCLKQRVHDVLLYDRILTEEEIKHNYKASLQYNGMTL